MVLLGRLENEKVASFARLSMLCVVGMVVWVFGRCVSVQKWPLGRNRTCCALRLEHVAKCGELAETCLKVFGRVGGSQKQRIYSTKRAKKWGFVVKITTGDNVGFSGVKMSKIVECCKKYNKKIVQNP